MNKKKTKFAWLRKFGYAFKGLKTSLKEESSLIVHFIVGAIVIIVGIVLQTKKDCMSKEDWAIVVLVIGLVISMELINTAVENLVDMISFKYNYNAKKIKDVAAAATLILSLTAIVVGLAILIPNIIKFMG